MFDPPYWKVNGDCIAPWEFFSGPFPEHPSVVFKDGADDYTETEVCDNGKWTPRWLAYNRGKPPNILENYLAIFWYLRITLSWSENRFCENRGSLTKFIQFPMFLNFVHTEFRVCDFRLNVKAEKIKELRNFDMVVVWISNVTGKDIDFRKQAVLKQKRKQQIHSF